MKKTISTIIAAALIFVLSVTAFAETTVPPQIEMPDIPMDTVSMIIDTIRDIFGVILNLIGPLIGGNIFA